VIPGVGFLSADPAAVCPGVDRGAAKSFHAETALVRIHRPLTRSAPCRRETNTAMATGVVSFAVSYPAPSGPTIQCTCNDRPDHGRVYHPHGYRSQRAGRLPHVLGRISSNSHCRTMVRVGDALGRSTLARAPGPGGMPRRFHICTGILDRKRA